MPEAWNEEYNRLFDRKIEKDGDGCLQDVHWYAGLFGYFPTYSLGALTAAQFASQLRIINGLQWVVGSLKSIFHARFRGVSVFHFHIFFIVMFIVCFIPSFLWSFVASLIGSSVPWFLGSLAGSTG